MRHLLLPSLIVMLLLAGCEAQKSPKHAASSAKAEAVPPPSAPSPEAQRWNVQGVRALQQKKYHEAIACFERALALAPEDAGALNNLGRTWFLQKDMRRAEAYLRKAVSVSPKNAEMQANLGDVLIGQGNDADAMQCYYRALDLEPRLMRAQYQLATLFMKKRQYKSAIMRLDRVLQANPSFQEAYLKRAIALHMSGDDQRAWKDVRYLETQGVAVHEDLRAAIVKNLQAR